MNYKLFVVYNLKLQNDFSFCKVQRYKPIRTFKGSMKFIFIFIILQFIGIHTFFPNSKNKSAIIILPEITVILRYRLMSTDFETQAVA